MLKFKDDYSKVMCIFFIVILDGSTSAYNLKTRLNMMEGITKENNLKF